MDRTRSGYQMLLIGRCRNYTMELNILFEVVSKWFNHNIRFEPLQNHFRIMTLDGWVGRPKSLGGCQSQSYTQHAFVCFVGCIVAS